MDHTAGELQSRLISLSYFTTSQQFFTFIDIFLFLYYFQHSNVSYVRNQYGVIINIDTTPGMPPNTSIGPSGFHEAMNKVMVIGSAEAVQMAVKALHGFIGILVAAPPSMPSFDQPQPSMGSTTVMYGQQEQITPATPVYPQQYQPQQTAPPQYGQSLQQQQQQPQYVHGSASSMHLYLSSRCIVFHSRHPRAAVQECISDPVWPTRNLLCRSHSSSNRTRR